MDGIVQSIGNTPLAELTRLDGSNGVRILAKREVPAVALPSNRSRNPPS